MDRYVRQYDKASMKKAILKQEETFKLQVHELHRLYQIQKLLMRDLKNTRGRLDKQKLWRTSDEYLGNGHVDIKEEEEIEVELTLAIGCNHKKREASSSPASNSATSFCSSSTDSEGVKLIRDDQWGLFQASKIPSDRKGITAFAAEERQRTESGISRPPWSFQYLSLKMT